MKLFVTHTDLDGIACFILSLKYSIDFDNYISVNYDEREKSEHIDLIKEYDQILYTDFAPSIDNLKQLSPETKVIILDHHKTTNKELNKFIKENPDRNIVYVYDENKCGASIFLDYIQSMVKFEIEPSVKQFIQLVENYDLWREDLGDEIFEQAIDLNRLLYKLIKWGETDNIKRCEHFIENQLKKFARDKNNFFYYDYEKKKIKESRDKEQEVLKKAKRDMLIRYDEQGRKFGLVCMRSKVSIVAHYFLRERTDIGYLIIINTYDQNNLKISMRSKHFNLLQLHEVRGHEHSAGVIWSQKKISKLWRGIIKNIRYKRKTR